MPSLSDGRSELLSGGTPRSSATPVVSLDISVDDIPRTLWLKLESANAFGSVKGRTAVALWQDVVDRVDPAIGIIESTSGNLGLALAAVAASHQVPFTAVVDPKTSGHVIEGIRALGGTVVMVDRPDGAGGYLLSRLDYIRQRLRAEPFLVWPNQYTNPANPRAHSTGTAPELRAQIPEGRTTVLVAVSTGGTLAGFRDFVTASVPDWELVGVDMTGSVALGGPHGRRVLSGIGASRPSSFLPGGFRPAVRITPQEAVSVCLWLQETAGLGVGASSGAVIAAALQLFRATARRTRAACLCADGADRYLGTVYSRHWRQQQRLTTTGITDRVKVLAVDRSSYGAAQGSAGAVDADPSAGGRRSAGAPSAGACASDTRAVPESAVLTYSDPGLDPGPDR